MYRAIDDFLTDWNHERVSTLRILQGLSDASLQQRVTLEGRSLGQIAWHVTLTLGEMMGRTGLKLAVTSGDTPIPHSAAEIAQTYGRDAATVAEQVRLAWSDSMLADSVAMYGESWRRGTVLLALIQHQAHHRGQITVLMRQAGLGVPGIYGPSREEWEAWNLPAPW